MILKGTKQLEKDLSRAHEELSALEAERERDIEEQLKAEALAAALESGDASGLIEAQNRRRALPWLVWAAKARTARLNGELRDARVAELGEQERSLEESLAKDPGGSRARARFEDVNAQRRMLEMGEDRKDVRALEDATPAVLEERGYDRRSRKRERYMKAYERPSGESTKAFEALDDLRDPVLDKWGGDYLLLWTELAVRGDRDKIGHSDGFARYRVERA